MLQGTLADSLLSQLQGKSQVRNKTLQTSSQGVMTGASNLSPRFPMAFHLQPTEKLLNQHSWLRKSLGLKLWQDGAHLPLAPASDRQDRGFLKCPFSLITPRVVLMRWLDKHWWQALQARTGLEKAITATAAAMMYRTHINCSSIQRLGRATASPWQNLLSWTHTQGHCL